MSVRNFEGASPYERLATYTSKGPEQHQFVDVDVEVEGKDTQAEMIRGFQ
jgi:hypothetical protein